MASVNNGQQQSRKTSDNAGEKETAVIRLLIKLSHFVTAEVCAERAARDFSCRRGSEKRAITRRGSGLLLDIIWAVMRRGCNALIYRGARAEP